MEESKKEKKKIAIKKIFLVTILTILEFTAALSVILCGCGLVLALTVAAIEPAAILFLIGGTVLGISKLITKPLENKILELEAQEENYKNI